MSDKHKSKFESKRKSVLRGEFDIHDLKALQEFAQYLPEAVREIEVGENLREQVKALMSGSSCVFKEARSSDYLGVKLWLECFEVKPNGLVGTENTLVLDRVVDPQNFGALIRTAAFFGFNRIVLAKDHQALLSDTVVRVSRGGLAQTRIFVVSNLSRALEALKANGHWIVGGSLDGTPLGSGSISAGTDVAVVVGSEEKGIRPGLLEKCDEKALIAPSGAGVGLESLNVSVAAGILCAYYKGVFSKK
jgi:tRNA G18 (ribose-2'-O)-methylase SpoU